MNYLGLVFDWMILHIREPIKNAYYCKNETETLRNGVIIK